MVPCASVQVTEAPLGFDEGLKKVSTSHNVDDKISLRKLRAEFRSAFAARLDEAAERGRIGAREVSPRKRGTLETMLRSHQAREISQARPLLDVAVIIK
jgi:hypothetical protein